jgi:hypothetical protein
VWAVAAVAGIVLLLTLLRLKGGLRRATRNVSDLADGREILIARGRRVTEELTDLADAVAEREDEGASKQHARALEVVASARSRIGKVAGPRVIGKAHAELDEAEWLIGVLAARLDGFVEPLRPRAGMPATCFFNGQHGLATVEVDLEGVALQRVPVRSCSACAVALVRGELPHVGFVRLGGRDIPWPAAPKWCGSYAWAAKDLKVLEYDGMPLFTRPERPVRQLRRAVGARARNARARVLPLGPELLPEDDVVEFEHDLESFDSPAPQSADVHDRPTAPVSSGAFAAMESEAPPEIDTSARAADTD